MRRGDMRGPTERLFADRAGIPCRRWEDPSGAEAPVLPVEPGLERDRQRPNSLKEESVRDVCTPATTFSRESRVHSIRPLDALLPEVVRHRPTGPQGRRVGRRSA